MADTLTQASSSALNGALLIDKAAGMSSHSVVARLRRIFPGTRFGHAGTLDPAATGLLVILAGQATKLQDLLLTADKEYEGEILFGIATDSDDTDGAVLARDDDCAFLAQLTSAEIVARIRDEFSGRQLQVPPQISAIQHEGVRSYRRARSGERVPLKARPVEIEFVDLQVLEGRRLYYRIRCTKGTYVRSLARDIGRLFDSYAVAARIRRLASGSFSLKDAETLDTVTATSVRLIPLRELVAELSRFEVDEAEARLLQQGRQESLQRLPAGVEAQRAVIVDREGEPLALLRCESERGWRLATVLRQEN